MYFFLFLFLGLVVFPIYYLCKRRKKQHTQGSGRWIDPEGSIKGCDGKHTLVQSRMAYAASKYRLGCAIICRRWRLLFGLFSQLYNEVQARRGANDITSDAQKNIGNIECGLGQNSNLFATEYHSKNHQTPHHYGNGCNYSPSGYSYLVSEQHSPVYRHTNGVPEIGDLLQDYLGQGKQIDLVLMPSW